MKKGNLRGFWVIIALAMAMGFLAGCDSPTNPANGFLAVSSITNVPTSGTVGNLSLYGTVIPSNATNQAIAWSIASAGATGATVSGNTLTTTAAGTVTVRATIKNGAAQGKDYTQNFPILINPAAITYTVVQTGGVDGQLNSTGIVFNFSASVDSLSLTADDISVSGAAGKDTAAQFTKSTENTWLLSPITVSAAGNATVSINKDGIDAGTKNVTVYKEGEYAPVLTGITAVYNQTATVYPSTPLDGLKSELTVTAQYTSGPDSTLDANEYDLSVDGGALTVPSSTVTVTYQGKTDTFTVTVTAAGTPPDPNSGSTKDDAIPLTENVWANGNIAIPGGQQWFTFTATAPMQYLHIDFGTLYEPCVQVYDSGSAAVESETAFWNDSNTYTSRSLTRGQTYYIRVRSWDSDNSGTYRIAFNASTTAPTPYPPGTAFIPLTENQWAAGNLSASSDEQWFTFTATAPIQYIHIEFDTMDDLSMRVYRNNGETVKKEARLQGFLGYNHGWLSLVPGWTYYIRMRPYSGYGSTYRITFNATPYPPGTAFIPLTENVWTGCNLPASNDIQLQWFTFTATASAQYLHTECDTLTQLDGYVFGNSGTEVKNYTKGETYYLLVYHIGGTYRIMFNATPYPPGTAFIPLTENQWEDGNLPTSSDVQWFTFDATAPMQYLHAEFGALSYLSVQVYDSGGAEVENETYWRGGYISLSLAPGETYYIRVRSYSGDSGAYRITFNATPYPPGTAFIPLTKNQWEGGNLPTSSDYQWFSFTATASMQYLHIDFGTLNGLYVKVYDSGSAEIVRETSFWKYSTTYTSLSLTPGQTYYIRVSPWDYSGGGTYRIGFNTTIALPGTIPLTENQWEGGSLPTSSDVQWFSFDATASTQYIHVEFGALTDLYVQVYDSAGATSGSETNLYGNTKNTTRTLTAGQTYYIRVRPYNSSYSGTYRITFNATPYPPGTALIPLTKNQWEGGDIATPDGQQWYSLTATAPMQYLHIDFGTLTNLYVQVYDSSGAAVESETRLESSSTKYTSLSLAPGETYYIRVESYNSGTYRIGFNATFYPPGTTLIPLTENQWEGGNIATPGGQQWFSFDATASIQYLHIEFGTLEYLYVQVYDSGGAAVKIETNDYITYTSRSLAPGETYYIIVRTYSGFSGTYRITFNTTPPTQ